MTAQWKHGQPDYDLLKRSDVEKNFKVIGGLIKSPGKFEDEPIYVPYFWQIGLEGCADQDRDGDFVFHIDASDVEMWPELRNITRLQLWEDDNGFVRHIIVKAP
jgi:hypothetical protein